MFIFLFVTNVQLFDISTMRINARINETMCISHDSRNRMNKKKSRSTLIKQMHSMKMNVNDERNNTARANRYRAIAYERVDDRFVHFYFIVIIIPLFTRHPPPRSSSLFCVLVAVIHTAVISAAYHVYLVAFFFVF